MAKGFNTRSVEGFTPGMENDPEFLGVSFRRAKKTEDLKENLKDAAKFLAEKCVLYKVKPLGAVAALGKMLDKGWIQAIWDSVLRNPRFKSLDDQEKADTTVRAYLIQFPSHEIDVAKVLSIVAGTKKRAEDLLAQV